mgnify:CR=1 FL=1
MVRDLPFRPTQTYKVVHGVFGCKHDMTPNFISGWACPSLSVMQNLNEFGLRTNIASRPACFFRVFSPENPRTSIECLKPTKFGANAGHGDAKVWKQFGRV